MADIDLLTDVTYVSRALKLGAAYHIGIAVQDIEAAVKRYSEVFGIEHWRGRDPAPAAPAARPGEPAPPPGYLRWAYSDITFPWVEFIQPVGDDDWAVPRFLRERGEGVHHVGYFVDDVDEAVRQAEAAGIAALPTRPLRPGEKRPAGAVAYLDPSTTFGVSIELVPTAIRETLVGYVTTGVWKYPDNAPAPGIPREYRL